MFEVNAVKAALPASLPMLLLILSLMTTLTPVYAGDITPPRGIITLGAKPSPELKLNNLDGEAYDLKNASGHWAFVHFWASWCGPCRREMPTIQKMSNMLKDTTLEIVLINTAENDDTAFSFLGIVAPDFVPLMDYDGLVTRKWQPRGLPSTFLVDPEGRQRYLALGGREWDSPEFIDFIRKVIAQP